MAMSYLKFLCAFLVAAVLGLCGQTIQLYKEKAAHQETKTQHAEVLRDLADKSSNAYRLVLKAQVSSTQATNDLDSKYTKELNAAKLQISNLQSAVSAGNVRLRIQATCEPTTRTGLSKASLSTSMDDAKVPRLTDSAERDYFALRDGIETTQKQLEGLQNYVKDVCLR